MVLLAKMEDDPRDSMTMLIMGEEGREVVSQ
jgi:hypothetical protein